MTILIVLLWLKIAEKLGWEEIINSKDKKYDKNYTIKGFESESERCSRSRTKRRIRELALANDFEYFVTITVNSKNADRFSLDECQDLLKKTIKEYKRTYNALGYIIITERHKDGAFHFHGLMKGLNEKDLYTNENNYTSSLAFDKIGYNSFSKIHYYNATCNYIVKYISKHCVKNSNNQIYIRSRNLKEPLHYEIMPLPSTFKWKYENDYVKITDYCLKDMTSQELLAKIYDENIREK